MDSLPEKYRILEYVDAPVVVVEADGTVFRSPMAVSLLRELSDASLRDILHSEAALAGRGISAAASDYGNAVIYTLSEQCLAPGYAGSENGSPPDSTGSDDSDELVAERLAGNVRQREAMINISLVCAYSEGSAEGIDFAVSEICRTTDSDCVILFTADSSDSCWKSFSACAADGVSFSASIPFESFEPVIKKLDEKSCSILTGLPEAALVTGRNGCACAALVEPAGERRAVLWLERHNPHGLWLQNDRGFIYVLVGVLKMALRRDQMEKELLRALSDANSANVSKTQFVSNVSHEIRTPINAILGMTRLAMESRNPDEIALHLRKVENAGMHLLGIVNDLLDISRIESGKLTLSPSNFMIRELADDVCGIIYFTAAEKQLSFTCKCEYDLPECLFGDSQRISQVLINLLNNAVKFTDSGSVSFHILRDGEWLRFDIADTGRGIRQEDISRLFGAFERLDGSEHIEGTGLGLNITKSIITLMGGTIDVSSTIGSGTVFTVRLPLVPGDASQVRSRHEPLAFRAPTARALAVDDNSVNQTVMLGLLNQFGISADSACNGQDAVNIAFEKKYDIIFMDQMMPIMDGRTAARLIRSEGVNSAVPIIALTADASESTRVSLLHAGMNDVITKPVFPRQLGLVLKKWLAPGLIQDADSAPEAIESGNDEPDDSYGIPGVQGHIAEQRMGCGKEFYIEALRLTAESIPVSLDRYRELLEKKDLAALRIEAHGAKGLFNTIGAYVAAELALQLEKAAAGNSIALAQEAFSSLEAASYSLYSNISNFLNHQEDRHE